MLRDLYLKKHIGDIIRLATLLETVVVINICYIWDDNTLMQHRKLYVCIVTLHT